MCEHLHYPLQSGSDRVLAAMHRGYTAERYLERLADARRVVPDLAVSTDIIVGFPGETDDDFERTLEVAAAAEYDYAYTFIFSPRPGTEAATMTDVFVDPAVAGERFARLRVVVERSALAKHEARVGRVEEVLVEGPSKKDPNVTSGRTRQNKLVHFRPDVPLRTGQLRDGRDHPRRTTSPARRRSSTSSPSRGTSCGSRSPRCDVALGAPARRGPRADGVGQVGGGDGGRPASRRRRAGLRRRDAGLPGDGHRHRQADTRRAGRGAAPPHRPRRSRRRVHGRRVPDRGTGARWTTSPDATTAPLLVAGTGLYHRVVIDDIELPGQWPDVRAELEQDAERLGAPALHARLAVLDPVAAGRMEPTNTRRVVRALEVCVGSGRPFSSFGPGLDVYPPTPVVQLGLRWPRARLAERIEQRVQTMIDAGLVDEVAALLERPISRTARQALGYKELIDHLEGRCTLDAAIATIVTGTRQFAVRQERWFRRDPRVRWIDIEADPVAEALPAVVDALAR